MATREQPLQGLESRVLNFKVPSDWNNAASRGSSPSAQVQRLLEANKLWGDQFRYGSAASSDLTDRELRSQGKVASQPTTRGGALLLYSSEDGMYLYCNANFFLGKEVIVVYDIDKLKQTWLRGYKLIDQTGLVAIVRPIFTHPDS